MHPFTWLGLLFRNNAFTNLLFLLNMHTCNILWLHSQEVRNFFISIQSKKKPLLVICPRLNLENVLSQNQNNDRKQLPLLTCPWLMNPYLLAI